MPAVWWNVSHVVVTGYVPWIVPPSQHRLPVPEVDTGQSSTWVHDADRASTASRPVTAGLYLRDCGPDSTVSGVCERQLPGGGAALTPTDAPMVDAFPPVSITVTLGAYG